VSKTTDEHRLVWGREVTRFTFGLICAFFLLTIVLAAIHALEAAQTPEAGAVAGSTKTLAQMSAQNSAESLTTVVDLTKALIWPAAILLLVARFEEPLMGIFDRLSKITVKAAGSEATLEIEKKATTVAALVGAATAVSVQTTVGTGLSAAAQSPAAGTILESAAKSRSIVRQDTVGKFAGRSILWVDDRPANNKFLIEAFRELRMNVQLALTTEEAIEQLDRERFDVIISDMGRPGDDRAGYTLLRALSERGNTTPVIVYAGSDSEELRKEAIAAGAFDSTNSPQRVFDAVTSILIGDLARPKKAVSSVRGG
jgi:CheY-like chemotaxis protein